MITLNDFSHYYYQCLTNGMFSYWLCRKQIMMLLLMLEVEMVMLSKHIQLHMSMLKTLNQVAQEQLHRPCFKH